MKNFNETDLVILKWIVLYFHYGSSLSKGFNFRTQAANIPVEAVFI